MMLGHLLRRMAENLPFQTEHSIAYALTRYQHECTCAYQAVEYAPWVKALQRQLSTLQAHPPVHNRPRHSGPGGLPL